MYLESLIKAMRPAIEEELRAVLDELLPSGQQDPRAMLAYHLGWEGEGAGVEAQGKRIRPLLVLLSAQAASADSSSRNGAPGEEDWRKALPAAAAVELVHNFSLIHDDIEDQSRLRRGRPTVWVKWGTAQAINAGDMMFTLAHLALLRLEKQLPPAITLEAARILGATCMRLTEGQYLDMSYESTCPLPVDAYWPMVGGKTAALLGCCTELGALAAGADAKKRDSFRRFGVNLGLAFQVLDDWLGIWGDAALTGKSTESDLLSGKKTLPVLYGLSQQGRFARRWSGEPLKPEEVPMVSNWLVEEGAQEYTQKNADRLTAEALDALEQSTRGNEAALALREMADMLLKRKY